MAEKEKKFSYFFCYVGRDNKIGNILADTVYEINTRDNIKRAIADINRKTNGNYRALIYFKKLKYVESKNDTKE